MGMPLRALMVEDLEDDVLLIARALRHGGYDLTYQRVDTAKDMRAALADQEWDIVIADYSMPQFDGLAALKLLRDVGLDLPFIIVSGTIGEDIAVAAMKAGAHDYVMKHNLARLVPAVERELHEAQVRRARRQAEAALRESTEKIQAMFESATDGITFADLKGNIVELNQAAAQMVGYECREELIGRNALDFIPESDRAEVLESLQETLTLGRSGVVELKLLSRDGKELEIDLSAVLLKDDQGAPSGFVALTRDITERKKAEEALRQRTAQLEALQQVGLELTAQLDMDTLLHSIVSRAIELLSGTSGGLYLYRPEQDLLEWGIGIGPHLPPIGSVLQLGEGLCGTVWETGEPLIVNDYQAWEGRADVFDDLENVASVGALVRWGDESLGVLNVLADVNHDFTPADAELLSLFATQAAIVIRNARLYEAADSRAERLAVVNHIARAVGATLDQEDLLETVYQEITSIFQADAFFVALCDDETRELDFRIQVDQGVRQLPERQPMDTGLTSLVVVQKKPLLIRDFEREQDLLPEPSVWGTMILTASWLGVPMLIGERLVGIISVQSYRPHAYGSEDQQLLSTIADQVAVALEKAQLYQILHDSEERYRTLFEQASDAVFVHTRQGDILDVNERACHLLGYDRSELLSRTMHDIMMLGEQQDLSQLVQGKTSEGGAHIEAEGLRQDGTRVSMEMSTTLLEVGGQDLVLALVRDITERKRAERLLQALNDAALAVEQALTPEEIFTAMGEEFKKIGFSCAILLLDNDRDRLLPRYYTYDAKTVKAAEKLLGIRADRFSVSVDDSDAFRIPIREGRTVFFGGEEATREALPKPLAKFAKQITKILKVGRTIDAPLIVEDDVVGLLSVQSDDLTKEDIPAVTAFANQMAAAWHKAQLMLDLEMSLEELQQTQSQLFQSQKMEALGRLAGGIAHDFNNLLTVIDISTRLLERQLHTEDPLWEHVQRIRETGDRAANLTKQLLSFSRREIIEPQVVNLNDLIGDLSGMLQRVIGEDIKLVTTLAGDLRPVKVDATQMEQVIVNLVVNARDAMPQGGNLRLETANIILDETHVAQTVDAQPGEHVMLTISDTGVGMDDEIKDHLFEPFFTTKKRGQGTGLGLPIVFGIVRQSRGHIEVYSEVGRGTTFRVYLPTTKDAVTEPSLRVVPHGATQGTETVLVVEDEPAVRGLAVNILEAHGYQVLAAANGSEALRIGEEHDGPIHLLLTDVVMPQMNGRELADHLQVGRPPMRVLYMSGYSDDVIAHHGVLEEGMAILAKPFTLEALTQKVRAILDAPA